MTDKQHTSVIWLKTMKRLRRSDAGFYKAIDQRKYKISTLKVNLFGYLRNAKSILNYIR